MWFVARLQYSTVSACIIPTSHQNNGKPPSERAGRALETRAGFLHSCLLVTTTFFAAPNSSSLASTAGAFWRPQIWKNESVLSCKLQIMPRNYSIRCSNCLSSSMQFMTKKRKPGYVLTSRASARAGSSRSLHLGNTGAGAARSSRRWLFGRLLEVLDLLQSGLCSSALWLRRSSLLLNLLFETY